MDRNELIAGEQLNPDRFKIDTSSSVDMIIGKVGRSFRFAFINSSWEIGLVNLDLWPQRPASVLLIRGSVRNDYSRVLLPGPANAGSTFRIVQSDRYTAEPLTQYYN